MELTCDSTTVIPTDGLIYYLRASQMVSDEGNSGGCRYTLSPVSVFKTVSHDFTYRNVNSVRVISQCA